MKTNTLTPEFLLNLSNTIVTYYECEYDIYGQRTGNILKFECSQLELDVMRMNGKFIYTDYLMCQRAALS